jgi:hypothetical protein
MYYVIIQVFKEEYLDDIMLALTTAGIENGTIVDGINSDNVLNQHIPLFTGLIPHDSTSSRYCKIVTTTIDSMDKIDALSEVFDDADVDFREEGVGRLIVIPAVMVVDENTDWHSEN